MAISHKQLARVVCRCIEIGTQEGIDATIIDIYEESFAAGATAYVAAESTVSRAIITCEERRMAADKALAALNTPYKKARSALRAVRPGTAVSMPETLKVLTTDTDKLAAIEWLMNSIQASAGKLWADNLLTGDFGVCATETMAAIRALVTAGKALTKAKMDRADAYEPTNEMYVAFKRVVRDALGSGSKEYQRIRLRAPTGSKKDEQQDGKC